MTPQWTPQPTTPIHNDSTIPPMSQHFLDTITALATWCTARPWLAAVAAAVAVAGFVLRAKAVARRAAAMHRGSHLITIVPPPEVEPEGALVFWGTLFEILTAGWLRRWRDGRAHIAIEYRWSGRQLTVAVWVPGTVAAGPIHAAIRGAWPGAGITTTDADSPLPAEGIAVGGALAPALPAWYPLKTNHDTDPLRTLIAAASGLHAAETACVQILARPASRRQITKLRKGTAALRTGGRPTSWIDPATWLRAGLALAMELFTSARRTTAPRTSPATNPALIRADPQRDRDAKEAVDKLTGAQWAVAIRYAVAHTNPRQNDPANLQPRLATVAHGLASAFGAWTGRNRLRRIKLAHPQQVMARRPLRHGFVLNATELSSLAALPHDLAVPGLLRSRAKAVPAPVDVPAGGRGNKVLGRAELGGHAVALPVVDARQHVHILGSTGSGKSTLMLNMALDDIHAGRGTVVIDPKGDLVHDILARIPARMAKRVTIIDPDQNPGATLNPLQGDDHDLTVDNIVSIFSRIFSKHWGPRIDDVLRVACLTLLRKANATLTLVPPLLNDKQFRHAFTADLDDPDGLLGFWQWFESTPPPLRAQVIGPVLSRLRAFLLRDFVRRTLSTPESSFDMRRVLDGGILLCRLPKGQIGEETARLMGSFVVASAWQAATARTRLPEDARKDCSIFIDECHNFLNMPGSVADMLAEARGYRMGMVLAHQNLTQLPRETQLALSANARSKVFFNCAPEDAHQLARHTMPELSEHDLSHMDAYRAGARLLVNGRETPAFTLHTNPPRPEVGESTAIRQAVAQSLVKPKQAAIAKLAGLKPADDVPDADEQTL